MVDSAVWEQRFLAMDPPREEVKVKHVHIETSSNDCDGRLDTSSIDTREFHSLIGWNLGIGHVTKIEYDLNDDFYRATIFWQHEEGHKSVYMYECDDDCDVEERSQRDHSAEAMGY